MIYLAVICGFQIVVIVALIETGRREREGVRAERADLLQRIQAPQYAVMQHHYDHDKIEAPPAINTDLDEDYWISKEDLARLAAEEEVTGGD